METIQHKSAIITRKILASYVPTYSGKPIVIAVAGGSCSGKTSTILQYLAENLGDTVTVLSIDNFQLGENFPKKDISKYRWDDPDNFALDEISKVIHSLKNNIPTTIPKFHLEKNVRIGSQKIYPNKYVIVEGIYASYRELEPLADVRIYLETSFFGRLMRRIFRFTLEDKIDLPEVPVRHMTGPTYRAHSDHVSKQKNTADLIIYMPYFFEETLSKFQLQHIHNPLNKPLEETYFQSPEGVVIGKSHNNFVVVYKNQILYSAQVEKETFDSLKHINFTES